jgi:molybdenum cofactor biosynthesis enzyme MoaA
MSTSAHRETGASHHGGSARLVTIFLTSDCNLKCPYCYALENAFQPGEVWDSATIGPLLDRLAQRGYRISIGGGEPLTDPELTLAVARAAAGRGMAVSLLTNGYLLDEALLGAIHKAGIGWVQISADSAGEVERFSPLLASGGTLGLRMAVGTVLLPERVPEIRDMHAAIAASDATGWRILRYTPLNEGELAAKAPTNAQWIEALLAVEAILRPMDSPVQIRYEPSVVPLGWLRAQPPHKRLDVCGGRRARRLFLYPNGEVFACGLPRRKGISLGNYKSDHGGFERRLDQALSGEHPYPAAGTSEPPYCRDVCQGGCVQMRGELSCDPRCERDKGLVPLCCFEKLLLSPGQHAPGMAVYPSELYGEIGGMS